MSCHLGANAAFFVCETGYGESFARPDCTRIDEGIVWAKPDLVRTDSLWHLLDLQSLTLVRGRVSL